MREPFSINPMLAEHIAPLTEEEFRLLEESLLAEGCRDPLVVWKEENVLVDGHNRKVICDKHGLTYSVVYRSFPGLKTAKAWMDLNQLGRRNLTKEQRNELIKRLAVGGVRQKDIAEKVGLDKSVVSRIVKDELQNATANDFTNSTPPDLTVTQKLKEEKDRLQKDLDKAVEMATAAEAKAAELYKAREKIRLEAEARANAEKELQTFKAEMQRDREEEIARRLEELKKNIKPEVKEVEVEVPVEDPTTVYKLKKALEEREKMEAELNKIKREQREMTRLEKDKVKLEAELKNLRMKARDEKAELTLYEAIDTIERVTFIRDRVHDLCNRNQLTISQLDKTETVLENLSIAIKEALVVVHASRGALTKEGGLKVVG